MPSHDRTTPLLAVSLVILLAYLAALTLVATYYNERRHFAWNEPIDWAGLASDIPHLSFRDYKMVRPGAWFPVSWAATTALLFCLSKARRPRLLGGLFGLQALIFLVPMGFPGLVSLVMDLARPAALDGEWLGEHWPLAQVDGLWSLFLAYCSWRAIKLVRPNQTLQLSKPS
jgi:hypothetical protein